MTWTRRRKALAAVAAVFIVVFAWFSYEVLAVYYAEPNPTVDSRAVLRSLALDGAGMTAEQGDTAWSLLVEIFDAVDAVKAEIDAMYDAGEFEPRDEWDLELDYGRVREGRTLPTHLEPERRAIALLHDGVFEKLRRFAKGPPGFWPMTGEGIVWPDGHFGDLSRGRARALAQVRADSMRLAAAGGDFAEAAAACDQGLALARTMGWQPSLMSYMTARAIEALTIGELRAELIELEFDEPACRALLASFDRHATFPPVTYTLEAERIHIADFVQWCYSDDGEGDGYLVAAPVVEALDYVPLRLTLFEAAVSRFHDVSRAPILSTHGTIVEKLTAAVGLPAAERGRALGDADAFVDALPDRFDLLRIAFSSRGSFLQIDACRQVIFEGTRLMVALELHRSVHGEYPASLDELAGEPIIDPLHGLPFGYRLLDDDPDGRGFLLYSTGIDRIDDWGADLDWVARAELGWHWPLTDPDATRVDFVINRPRRVWDD